LFWFIPQFGVIVETLVQTVQAVMPSLHEPILKTMEDSLPAD
jgi:hypothetical protein